MNLGRTLAKSAAVASSVVLLCGYVYDRAGGNLFHGRTKSFELVPPSEGGPALMPGSKSAAVWAPEDDPFGDNASPGTVAPATEADLPDALIPAEDLFASDSIAASSSVPPGTVPSPRREMLPGSKSKQIILAPSDSPAAAQQGAAPAQPISRRREMLPGSKSMPGVIAPSEVPPVPQQASNIAPPKPSKRRMLPGSKSGTVLAPMPAEPAVASRQQARQTSDADPFGSDQPPPEPIGEDPFALDSQP